jgi:hypothetical protein
VNSVANFAVDGRDARIVRAWRDNGNAHGYDLFLVLMPTTAGSADWNVVGFETGDEFSDQIRTQPHTGEDIVKAVRFVRGPNGQPLVAVATRTISEGYYDRAETTISIYELRRNEGSFGTTQDYFAVARRWNAQKRYCNAELALRDELKLPLPSDYAGPNKVDRCTS